VPLAEVYLTSVWIQNSTERPIDIIKLTSKMAFISTGNSLNIKLLSQIIAHRLLLINNIITPKRKEIEKL